MFTTAINFVISILFKTLLFGKNEKELLQVIFLFISLPWSRISLCDHDTWSSHGQIMVKSWSNHGQIMVKSWSDHGQVTVSFDHGLTMVDHAH